MADDIFQLLGIVFFLGPAFENGVIIYGAVTRCPDMVATETICAQSGEYGGGPKLSCIQFVALKFLKLGMKKH